MVCLCVSAAVSGTYEAAVVAQGLTADRDITVVDTQSLSMGQGYMVLAAAEAARAGATKEEVIAQARDVGER